MSLETNLLHASDTFSECRAAEVQPPFSQIHLQKYKKSLIIRTIIRKSLENWKIVFIFAAVNIQY